MLNFNRQDITSFDALESNDFILSDGGDADPLEQLCRAETELECSAFEVINITELITTKGH